MTPILFVEIFYTTATRQTVNQFDAQVAALGIPFKKHVRLEPYASDGGKVKLNAQGVGPYVTVTKSMTDTTSACPEVEYAVYTLLPEQGLVTVLFLVPPAQGCVYRLNGNILSGNLVFLNARQGIIGSAEHDSDVQGLRQLVNTLKGTPPPPTSTPSPTRRP